MQTIKTIAFAYIPCLKARGFTLNLHNWDLFFKCMTVESLKMMLETQIEQENFEMAGLLKKHIELKNK